MRFNKVSIKYFFQSNKCFVIVVILCDIFILDLNDFFYLNSVRKIGFSLINKIYAYVCCCLFFVVFVFMY